MPDAGNIKDITLKLQKALQSENQFVWNNSDRKSWEVTMSARDGAVHVMRFLKMWFDLPQAVFFTAVNYLDMFLARMKVTSLLHNFQNFYISRVFIVLGPRKISFVFVS